MVWPSLSDRHLSSWKEHAVTAVLSRKEVNFTSSFTLTDAFRNIHGKASDITAPGPVSILAPKIWQYFERWPPNEQRLSQLLLCKWSCVPALCHLSQQGVGMSSPEGHYLGHRVYPMMSPTQHAERNCWALPNINVDFTQQPSTQDQELVGKLWMLLSSKLLPDLNNFKWRHHLSFLKFGDTKILHKHCKWKLHKNIVFNAL